MTGHEERHRLLRRHWQPSWVPTWVEALAVLFMLMGIRWLAMLGPGWAQPLYLVYCAGALVVPLLLFSGAGRRRAGLRFDNLKASHVVGGLLLGAFCGLAFFYIGLLQQRMVGHSWLESVSEYLRVRDMAGLLPPLGILLLFLIPAATMTPVGEEVLLRGLVLEALSERWGRVIGILGNSLLNGVMYLYVHGVVRSATGLRLVPHDAVATMILLLVTGLLFSWLRLRSRSIVPAIAAHAGFNLVLVASVLYWYSK